MAGTAIFNSSFSFRFSRIPTQAQAQAPSTVPTSLTPSTKPIPRPHWASLHTEIETHLKQAIPMKEPLEVFQPMHHLVFSAPRTTVPALCLAACELVGGHRHQAMAAASALLLNLANAHAHEQLPLTDRPKPRPGPAHAYDARMELMTGDGLVPFGFELLARADEPTHDNSERILRVMIEISRAVGSEGLQHAQHMRNTLESDGKELSHVESMKRVAEKKEGGMHACGAACGAVMGGGSEEEIERLRMFGFYVGMSQGMLQRGLIQEAKEMKNMALQELQFFKDRDLHLISTFINF
ncbi:hypothetical protein Fmac_030624 [Flemingia macrophylla]|uniref:Uncharacterized protein n=1 Tax=Flemingia macrophylla TaxID=520843 RepID=A0ABD1L066_9FABA